MKIRLRLVLVIGIKLYRNFFYLYYLPSYLTIIFSQRLRKEKQLEIFLVLTPEYEGNPRDKSLGVYDEVATVFFISEVGADSLLSSVEEFEEGNCL